MSTWGKKPFRYTLVGLESGSAAKDYEVVITTDLRDGRRFVSCNCMSWTRGKHNKGLQNWERTCKHTQRGYTVDSPEIDFAGEAAATWIDEPEEGERIPFQKPMLPARFEEGRDEKILNDPDWVATVKMDGHRCLIVKQPYGKIEMFSRGGKRMMSVEPAFQDLGLAVGTMIDCELVVADINSCTCEGREKQRDQGWDSVGHFRAEHPESLRLVVLDVLFVDGKSVMSTPHWQRRLIASGIVANDLSWWQAAMVETKPDDVSTEDWLVAINERGAEGVVFWNRNSPYRPGIRSSTAMLKKKWALKTYDVILLGTLPPSEKMNPTHRRMSYGWADGKAMGVAPISGPAEEMEALVGQVIEVRANAVLPSGCLLYPRYVRTRSDLNSANECPVSV